MHRTHRLVAAGILAAATSVTAIAQDVALLYTLNPSQTLCWSTDPEAKIAASGYFNTVTSIDVGISTPTLTQLLAYQAVLVYEDYPGWQNAYALGDVLADYVDVGGGVVVAGFATFSNWLPLGGRWATGNYSAIISSGQNGGTNATMGTVHDPFHLSMLLVTSFDGGPTSHRPSNATIAVGARRIVDWSDGTPLVVQGALPNRIDLGFFPPSTDCSTTHGWLSSTDGDKLMANSLLSVSSAVGSQQATNTLYGVACGPQSLTGLTRPIIGTNWDLEVAGTPTAALFGLLLLDVTNPNTPLGAIAPGCTLLSGGLLISLLPVPMATPAFSLPLPIDPSLLGQEIFAQAGYHQPGVNPLGFQASNGLLGLIGDF